MRPLPAIRRGSCAQRDLMPEAEAAVLYVDRPACDHRCLIIAADVLLFHPLSFHSISAKRVGSELAGGGAFLDVPTKSSASIKVGACGLACYPSLPS